MTLQHRISVAMMAIILIMGGRWAKAYGEPDFALAVPMSGFVLRELYYPSLEISFNLAPTGPTPDRSVIASYVTYPEFLQRAMEIRKDYIKRSTGEDITAVYRGGVAT